MGGLDRFMDAQAPVMEALRAELAAGRKRTHWMWFVFPQIAGLGLSAMSRRYAIADLVEAQAYAAHPVLGPRLLDCTRLVLTHADRSANAILGGPDDMKFRSCMTLFERAVPDQPAFAAALEQFFAGQRDPATLKALA